MNFKLRILHNVDIGIFQRSRTPVALMMIVIATSAAVNLMRSIVFFPTSFVSALISALYIYFCFILYLLLQEFSKRKENSTIIAAQYQMDSRPPQLLNQVDRNTVHLARGVSSHN
jgi:hypothetical protein